MPKESALDSAAHYDLITEAWKYIFGNHFHLGYFTSPDMSLEDATIALIDALSNLGNFTAQTKVLDVGCGIGAPAFYLHQKHHCSIVGISTSHKGINLAQRESEQRGYSKSVRFEVADGQNNGFPRDSFDVVWLMESSHTMKNKKKLFSECLRVLKPTGSLLLCDLMMKRRPKVTDHFQYLMKKRGSYISSIVSLKKAFGRGRTETFQTYFQILTDTGFNDIRTIDISDKVLPTMDYWRTNVDANKDKIRHTLSTERIDDFVSACDLIEDLYLSNIQGYGLLSAVKR